MYLNQIQMMKTMKTDEVIDLIKQGIEVENIVLSDIKEKRLSFREALLLVENGFLVSEENMLYQDSAIANDPEFDNVNWKGSYTGLQNLLTSKGILEKGTTYEVITIELLIEDQEVKDWLNKNTAKLKDVMNKLVVDLYHTDKILHSE